MTDPPARVGPPGRMARAIVAALFHHRVFAVLHLPTATLAEECAVIVQRVLDAMRDDVKEIVNRAIDEAVDSP